MSANPQISSPLNEQQVMMLRLLKTPLPAEDFMQMRRLAVKLLAKQLDETVDEWEQKNGITEADYDKASRAHYRK